MAILGVGAVAGASKGAAAARDGGDVPASASGVGSQQEQEQTRPWNQHVDAQLHDLRNLRNLDAKKVQTRNLYNSSRDAEVVVWRDGSGIYSADTREETLVRTDSFYEAVQTAIDSLDDDRQEKQKVTVACSGTLGPHEWDGDVLAIDIPSYTTLDLRGTIYVEDEGEALVRPLRAKEAVEIEIPRVKIVGNFRSAIWFKGVRRVKFGHIDIRTPEDSIIDGTGGGVRIDGGRDVLDEVFRSRDIQVDSAYIENTVGHAFETYNVDRIQVGQVIANNPNYAGVLLNATTDSTVDSVIGKDVDVGGGYATFRVANGSHDITVGNVVANGGARGLFGVSNCHEITVGQVNIQETDAHGALIQDCQNYTIQGGVFKNCEGEAIRVDSRSSQRHPPAEGVTITNVRVFDDQDEKTQTYGINETGPGTANNRFINNDLRDAGTEANMSLFAPSTVVRNNIAGGVAHGTATLTAGESPAATVEGVTANGGVTLDLRAKPRSAPGSAFGYDHHFEWDGEQWNLHFEWTSDPGEDVDVDYIVDRPQANIGMAGPSEGDDEDSGSAEPEDGGTYSVTAQFNADDTLMTVEGDVTAGSNVYMQTKGEDSGQQWTFTSVGDGLWRIDVADNEGLVLAAAGGGSETSTNLVIEEWSDAGHQKWALNESGPGYTFEPSHANLAADVWEKDDSPGADIRHWNPTGDPNQTFVLSSGSGDGGGQEEFPFETTTGVVEGFEDGNLDGYNGATGDYEVDDGFPVAEGDYSLKGSAGEGSRLVTTDLDRSPAPGTKFSAKIGWVERSAENACIAFGTNETVEPAEGDAFPFHFIRLYNNSDDGYDWRFQMYDRTGGKVMAKTIDGTDDNTFYEVVVDWRKDGSMTVTLNDDSGEEVYTEDLGQVGGGTDWGDGGIGTRGTGLLDDVRIVENRRE